MPKINIYFEDLNDGAQEAIREAVQEELFKSGVTDSNSEILTTEMVDDYINRCNLVNEFTLAEGY